MLGQRIRNILITLINLLLIGLIILVPASRGGFDANALTDTGTAEQTVHARTFCNGVVHLPQVQIERHTLALPNSAVTSPAPAAKSVKLVEDIHRTQRRIHTDLYLENLNLRN